MADFIPVTASNQPRLHDHEAVEKIIQGYYVDPELELGVGYDSQRGAAFVYVDGFAWPEAWTLPDGVCRDEIDPHDGDPYEKGADGFLQLLPDLSSHLGPTRSRCRPSAASRADSRCRPAIGIGGPVPPRSRSTSSNLAGPNRQRPTRKEKPSIE